MVITMMSTQVPEKPVIFFISPLNAIIGIELGD